MPMGRAVYDSFFATEMFSPQPQFVGLEQYADNLRTSTFWAVVRNSVVWTVLVVLLQNVAGLAIAVCSTKICDSSGSLELCCWYRGCFPG